jgi:iron complex transport system ATP-binding protein
MSLQVTNVTVERNQQAVLDDISLSFEAGELVGIVGPNSAGKTTLLKAILGLVPLTRGNILLQGKPLASCNRVELAQRLAYIPQLREVHWPLSVRDVIALGRLPYHSDWSKLSSADKEIIQRYIELCELGSLLDRKITELSGGEMTRALLARALAVESDILLADEPINHLDPYYQLLFMQTFRQLTQQGKLVVLVIHDLTLAARFCDTVYLLNQGKVFAQGKPDEVLSNANIKQVYSVELYSEQQSSGTLVVPWRCEKG